MSGLVKTWLAGGLMLALSAAPALASDRPFNLGKIATAEEVAGWDIDVRPDGLGAPVGMGNAIDGEEIYADLCAACHGDFGEGVDRWPELVGGEGSLNTHDPLKTTGSYWPYASTLYDYIYRAMPFGEAQSLSHDETYQIVAFLLYMNDIVEDDFDLSHGNIGSIKMPNRDGFFMPDPRPDAQPLNAEPCMKNCNVATNIIGRARDIDVTPESES
jgi:cytochrome c|tara:strand:+ start:32 stop:676 length:645 start_codon:yes stop_codon:yes gene_type:complete